MALFNPATGELTLKVVYYGPPLSGKTTNLRFLHDAFGARAKGRLVSLATEGDRMLFVELVQAGLPAGGSARLQLYTVGGPVRHEATLSRVLQRCDAVVFVADSQRSLLDANAESLAGLREKLLSSESAPELPLVIQYNKRDLPGALPLALLERRLNPQALPCYEAVAVEGRGVEETLEAVTRLLSERATGHETQDVADVALAHGSLAATQANGVGAALDRGARAEGDAAAVESARPAVTPPPQVQLPDAPLGRDQWHYLFEGEQCGPRTLDELVDLLLGAIPEDTRVWRPGMEDWVEANRVAVIAEELPPPVPSAAAGAGDEDMPDFDTVPRMLRTVLIADEDAAFRHFLAMPLAALGFTIYEAADGEAAWQLAVRSRPWVMLADISMPELDGFEFCRRVRGHPLLSRRPLIFISGSDTYKERYRALQIGADDFLSKSMPIRELLMRMQLLMARYSDLGASSGERQAGEPATGLLEGRIEVFGAPALLQICNQGRLTGVLSAADEEGRGALVGFRDGEIVSALVDGVVGADGVYALLAWPKGSFRFTPGEPGRGHAPVETVEQLLLEGWRRLDEVRRQTPAAE
jgi:CheY-like chemotaxis protein